MKKKGKSSTKPKSLVNRSVSPKKSARIKGGITISMRKAGGDGTTSGKTF